jgi:hypothetical protein
MQDQRCTRRSACCKPPGTTSTTRLMTSARPTCSGRYRHGSSIAWTLAHVTHGVDSWFNVRFQGMQPHQLYAGGRFLFGGDGRATDWDTIRTGVNEVRKRAMPWLLDSATDFDLIVPYAGSYLPFRRHGMQLRAAVLQNAFHHVFHLGEIVTKREWLGYSTDRFPGDYTVAILRGSD